MKHVRLSYDIGEHMPLYPGTPEVQLDRMKNLDRGDSCNTYAITFQNHAGTHMDAPNHFHAGGRAVSSYSIDELIFRKLCVIDIRRGDGEPIMPKDIEGKVDKEADLLLMRTGFWKLRGTPGYTHRNPYIHPHTARILRDEHPNLRGIAVDTISIANHLQSHFGRQAHKILLEETESRKAILIFEDVDLSGDLSKVKEIMVVPLYVSVVDSTPCTIIGVVEG